VQKPYKKNNSFQSDFIVTTIFGQKTSENGHSAVHWDHFLDIIKKKSSKQNRRRKKDVEKSKKKK